MELINEWNNDKTNKNTEKIPCRSRGAWSALMLFVTMRGMGLQMGLSARANNALLLLRLRVPVSRL